jgi:hypothetical protein
MRTSFHHQPEAQHPNFPLSVSWQADYPIFWHGRSMCADECLFLVEKRSCSGHHRKDRILTQWSSGAFTRLANRGLSH